MQAAVPISAVSAKAETDLSKQRPKNPIDIVAEAENILVSCDPEGQGYQADNEAIHSLLYEAIGLYGAKIEQSKQNRAEPAELAQLYTRRGYAMLLKDVLHETNPKKYFGSPAIADLEEAVTQNDELLSAHAYLGDAYRMAGRTDEAEKEYRKVQRMYASRMKVLGEEYVDPVAQKSYWKVSARAELGLRILGNKPRKSYIRDALSEGALAIGDVTRIAKTMFGTGAGIKKTSLGYELRK